MNEELLLQLVEMLQVSLNDEISAAVFYTRAAYNLEGAGSANISKELKEHADDEYRHFGLLVNFASNYGLMERLTISFEEETNFLPINDPQVVLQKVQSLETEAAETYKKMAMICKELGIVDGCELFKQLVVEELEHFDDLSYVLGQKRSLVPQTEQEQLVDSQLADATEPTVDQDQSEGEMQEESENDVNQVAAKILLEKF